MWLYGDLGFLLSPHDIEVLIIFFYFSMWDCQLLAVKARAGYWGYIKIFGFSMWECQLLAVTFTAAPSIPGNARPVSRSQELLFNLWPSFQRPSHWRALFKACLGVTHVCLHVHGAEVCVRMCMHSCIESQDWPHVSSMIAPHLIHWGRIS